MPLSAIRDRSSVLRAIEELDRLGRDGFLAKYGFGHARAYELVFDGRRYDSKAILGAAHGFARPDLGPLTAADFTGGRNTVMKTLEGLGFEVQVDNEEGAEGSAFLLTWKASGWPHENILRMIETLQAQGFVDEPWRLRSSRRAKVGDQVWLLKQGPGPKVIFGEGVIAAGAPECGQRQTPADGHDPIFPARRSARGLSGRRTQHSFGKPARGPGQRRSNQRGTGSRVPTRRRIAADLVDPTRAVG